MKLFFKYFVFLLFLFIIILSIISCNKINKEDILFYKGLKFFNNQKYSKSNKYFSEAINHYTISNNKEKVLLCKLYMDFIKIEIDNFLSSTDIIKDLKSTIQKSDSNDTIIPILSSLYLAKLYLYNFNYNAALEELKKVEKQLDPLLSNKYQDIFLKYIIYSISIIKNDETINDKNIFKDIKYLHLLNSKNILLYFQYIEVDDFKKSFKLVKNYKYLKKDLYFYMLSPLFNTNKISYNLKNKYFKNILKAVNKKNLLYYYTLFYISELKYKRFLLEYNKINIKKLYSNYNIISQVMNNFNSNFYEISENRKAELSNIINRQKEDFVSKRNNTLKILLISFLILLAFLFMILLIIVLIRIVKHNVYKIKENNKKKLYLINLKHNISQIGEPYVNLKINEFNEKINSHNKKIESYNNNLEILSEERDNIKRSIIPFFKKSKIDAIEKKIDKINESLNIENNFISKINNERDAFNCDVKNIKKELNEEEQKKIENVNVKNIKEKEKKTKEIERKQYEYEFFNIIKHLDQHILRLRTKIDENIINIFIHSILRIKEIVKPSIININEDKSSLVKSQKERLFLIKKTVSKNINKKYSKNEIKYYTRRLNEIILEYNNILKLLRK